LVILLLGLLGLGGLLGIIGFLGFLERVGGLTWVGPYWDVTRNPLVRLWLD